MDGKRGTLLYYKISRFGFVALGAALFASFMEPTAVWVIGIVAFLAAVLMAVSSKKAPAVTLALFAAAFGTVLIGIFWLTDGLPIRKMEGRTVPVTGIVTELSTGKGNTLYRLAISSEDRNEVPRRATVSVSGYGDLGFEMGDRITGTVSFLPVSTEGVTQRLSDYADYRILRGFFEGTPTLLEKDAPFLGKTVTKLRQSLADILNRHFSDWRAPFTKALLLGIREELPGEVTGAFRRAGMSHIIAISGLHLSVLFGGLMQLLGKADRALWKDHLKTGVLIAAVIGYMALVGFGNSIRRAGIMLIFYLLARCMLARVAPIENLGGAIIIVLLIDPMAVCDGGFLLSVLCTAGILLFLRPLRIRLLFSIKNPRLRYYFSMPITIFSMSLVTATATIPVAVFYYGSVSLVAPFSNLLSGILTEIAVIFSFLTVLFGLVPFLSPLAAGCAFLAGTAENLLYKDAAFFADLPLSYVELEKGWIALAILGSMTVLILPLTEKKRSRRNWRLAAVLSAFLFLFGETAQIFFYRNTVKTTVTALREGTAITCERNDSAILLARGLSPSDTYALSAPVGQNTLILLNSENSFAEKDICDRLKPKKACVTFPESTARMDKAVTAQRGIFRFGENALVRFGDSFAEIDTGEILILYIFGKCDIMEIEARFRQADLVVMENVSPKDFPEIRCQVLVLREQSGFFSGTEKVYVLFRDSLTFCSRGKNIKKGGSLS